MSVYSVSDVNAIFNVSAVVVGSTVTFGCHVNNSEKFMWDWESKHVVYGKNRLVQKFAERHSVINASEKTHLTIKNIEHCDAGFYRCILVSNNLEIRCKFLLITFGKYSTCMFAQGN